MFFERFHRLSMLITRVLKNPFYRYVQIKLFWRNRHVLTLVVLIVLLNIVMWAIWGKVFVFSGFVLKELFVSHPEIFFVSSIFVLPILNSFISLLNLFLSFLIYKKNALFSFLLMGSAIFINLSFLLSALFYILTFRS